MSHAVVRRRVQVEVPPHPYRVEVGSGLLEGLGGLVHEACHGTRRALLVFDAALPAEVVGAATRSLADNGFTPATEPVEASEVLKSPAGAERLWRRMLEAGLDRTAVVVVLGGGVVGDLGAFAAATFMRGVDCVQVPTTLLAMVDAAVGGKSAVNLELPGGGLAKNMVGAFRQPRLVVCDVAVLRSLPPRTFRCGLAECLKHGLIADPSLLEWMESRRAALEAREPLVLAELVARSVKVKADVVARDEREEGDRALLNLGHTFAHAIEGFFHEDVPHGEAVGLGLVAATATSVAAGLLPDPSAVTRIRGAVAGAGLPVALPRQVEAAPLLELMGLDKKRRAGRWRLILPVAAGGCRVVEEPPRQAVVAGWKSIGVLDGAAPTG